MPDDYRHDRDVIAAPFLAVAEFPAGLRSLPRNYGT